MATPSIRSFEHALARQRAARASRLLLDLLKARIIDPNEFDTWGRYAGQIDQLFIRRRRITASLKFWMDLLACIRQAERVSRVHVHKGLILFKIAVRRLSLGYSWPRIARYLAAANLEDRLLYPSRGQDPRGESAYRLLIILRLMDHFLRKIKDPKIRNRISQSLQSGGGKIGTNFLRVYDQTLISPGRVREVPPSVFRQLLGNGQDTVLVAENYAGASFLIRRRREFEQTNLEKYGLAKAAIVLCGSTIEGVLARRRHLTKKLAKGRRNLAVLTRSYLEQKRVEPELISALFFLWFIRDLIHPEVMRGHRGLIVDMNLADFVYTLTGTVLLRLARKSRRKMSRT